MSSPIEVKGHFRGQILETLHEIKRTQTKASKLMADLEAIAQNAATCQGVDLKLFVLDVDTLEFTERPRPNSFDPDVVAEWDAAKAASLAGNTVPDATGDSVTTE